MAFTIKGQSKQGRIYNWKPDLPDFRDYKFVPKLAPELLPSATNNAPLVAYVDDQGQLGSCTGNGEAMCFDYARAKEGLPLLQPSRLFIYYNERVIEGTVNQDSGAQVRDGISSLADIGVCPETEWPYDVTQFTVKPPDTAYTDAANNKIKQYERVDNRSITHLKSALAQGHTFVFGFSVYSSFESSEVTKTGIVPMPTNDDEMLGGHCVCGVDYDDSKQWIKCKNSWGESWGDKGFFYLPYAYITNEDLASDFWVIKLV